MGKRKLQIEVKVPKELWDRIVRDLMQLERSTGMIVSIAQYEDSIVKRWHERIDALLTAMGQDMRYT